MRVLHIGLEKAFRGAENQILLLAQGLKKKGVESFVAYPKISKAVDVFKKEVEVLSLPSSKSYDLRSVYLLIQFCKSHKIDIINAQSSGAHGLALFVKLFLPNIKIVVHRRVSFPLKNRLSTRRKYLNPKVEHFVCISEAIKNILIQYGVEASKISTVKSAVDISIYNNKDRTPFQKKLRDEFNAHDAQVIIGMASALTEEKGHNDLIHALKLLKDRGYNYHCFIAGEGALRDQLEELCRTLKIDNTVTFVGFRKNIAEFLLGLDIFVMPSLNEGLGTLVLDAIGAGCAVIGTNVGGIPEMIVHQKTGLLAKPLNPRDLYEKLKIYLDKPELKSEHQKIALNHLKENFSLESMIEGNYQVYKKLIPES